MKIACKMGLAIALVVFCCTQMTFAELITLQTGNGQIGELDSQISGIKVSDGTAFSVAQFEAARNGASALVEDDYNGRSDFIEVPGTHWIVNGNWRNGCALYAHEFTITEAFTSASLDFTYSVDNNLGSASLSGLYVNGQAIIPAAAHGTYSYVTTIADIDIAPYLVVGENVLYTYQYDYGYGAGVSYLAEITTVPEPLTAAFLGLGGIAFVRKKK